MNVTIVDRAEMDKLWGTPSFPGVILVTIEIGDQCAVLGCGCKRGEPYKRRFHEFGEYYYVDTWSNACGHLDKYTDLFKEAGR